MQMSIDFLKILQKFFRETQFHYTKTISTGTFTTTTAQWNLTTPMAKVMGSFEWNCRNVAEQQHECDEN
jgi:hypothetical protein